MKNRKEKIAYIQANCLKKSATVLEISPGINPMLSQQDGYNVDYLDTCTTEELRSRAVGSGRDASGVPSIHHLYDRSRPIADCVGGKKFDFVVSSHVIEHVPDLVGHFQEVSGVLRKGGAYAFLASDKNLCFDARKPDSSLGQIVEASVEKRKFAPVSALIDEYYYGVRRAGRGAWSKTETALFTPKYTRSKSLMLNVLQDPGSVRNWRGHIWRFTPESFSEVFCELGQLGLVDLRLIEAVPTDHMDFIAVLGA